MISKRLKEIAKMIDKDKVVFDVGSDHALLPCFLIQHNITKKVYAGDNKKGPLNNAIENIKKHHYEDYIIPVLSDGLEKVNDDVEVVVIAGMGYYTIEHILDNCDISKYDYLIVQTNSDVNLLRKYISDHHYTIEDERIIYDGFYYQIIKFSKSYHEKYSDLEIEFGPILLKNRENIFIDYLSDLLKRLQSINTKANSLEIENKIKQIEEILYN